MTHRVPPTRRAEIVAMLEAATPGPWKCRERGDDTDPDIHGPKPGDSVATVDGWRGPPDGHLIATLRNEAAALLADLEDAERENERIQSEMDRRVGDAEFVLRESMADYEKQLDEARAVAKGARKEALEEAHERLSGFDCGRRSDDWTDGFDAAVDIVHAMKEPK